jgi:hypothetical protein
LNINLRKSQNFRRNGKPWTKTGMFRSPLLLRLSYVITTTSIVKPLRTNSNICTIFLIYFTLIGVSMTILGTEGVIIILCETL